MFKKFLFISLIIILVLSTTAFAASDPKLIRTLNNGLTKIKEWIIKLSTPAAAVAIGTGILMKKFSFGDEERIIMRQKTNKEYTIFLCLYSLC